MVFSLVMLMVHLKIHFQIVIIKQHWNQRALENMSLRFLREEMMPLENVKINICHSSDSISRNI